MFATNLQFDVLFWLKDYTNNYDLRFDDVFNLHDDVHELFFHNMIKFSIRGIHGYKPYANMEKSDNPILFVTLWFYDIYDTNDKYILNHYKTLFAKVFSEYYTISWYDVLDDKCDRKIFDVKEEFDKIFPKAKEMYSIVTADNFFNCFHSHTKKYYLIEDDVIKKTYNNYEELYNEIKDKFENCYDLKQGHVIIDDNNLHGTIVVEDYMNREYKNLANLNYRVEPWKFSEYVNKYGYEALAPYCKPFLDCGYCCYNTAVMISMSYNASDNDLEKWIAPFIIPQMQFGTNADMYLLIMKAKECSNPIHKERMKKIISKLLNEYIG